MEVSLDASVVDADHLVEEKVVVGRGHLPNDGQKLAVPHVCLFRSRRVESPLLRFFVVEVGKTGRVAVQIAEVIVVLVFMYSVENIDRESSVLKAAVACQVVLYSLEEMAVVVVEYVRRDGTRVMRRKREQ